MNPSPLLQCKSLSFSYSTHALLHDINLSFKPGEFVGLIGANGAGKSTLLQLLLGLLSPDAGEIKLLSDNLAQLARDKIAREIAFVPQDHSIEYAFSVSEMVAMGRNPYLGSYHSESAEDLEIIQQALARADLLHLADKAADQLSGGERQRVFIARSLAQQTRVMLLDEPTASLDLCHQLDLMTLIRELTQEGQLAIAAIHDLELASRFCDRLILLAQGNIVADGPADEVLSAANLREYFAIEASVTEDVLTGGLRITAHRAIR